MITFAAPQCAWFLLFPAGIVVLYLLRRKYLPKQVPSTFLWRTAIRDHAANKPLQRLRKNILLPVQFLAALVLALALMQPNLSTGAASRTNQRILKHRIIHRILTGDAPAGHAICPILNVLGKIEGATRRRPR